MLNQLILVGVVKHIELFTKGILHVQLAVARNYRDESTGEYTNDYITVAIDDTHEKYLKLKQTIAVKARIIQPIGMDTPSFFAEKVSFID